MKVTISPGPLQQPSSDHFRNFDDDTTNLISSLHLDPEDEPRRGMNANSRANSVRFDETANQNHFSHSSRPSVEFMSRTSSGLGGLQMTERTSSHKSEGRASSQHSIRSAASGRANSLNLDSSYSIGGSSRSPLDTPGLAPGLLLLGSVPAIIRCWMNENFKHDALLYAAVCTGSYKSYLDRRLIQNLGFEDSIVTNAEGVRTVELHVHFPEAIPHPASSRSSSPVPHLPCVTVAFQVVDNKISENDKTIQIFLGSDVLRAHSADILFSSNTMTIFDDDRSKVSIPLVRPESEAAFKSLFIASGTPQIETEKTEDDSKDELYLNGLGRGSSTASVSSNAASPPPSTYRTPGVIAAEIETADAVDTAKNAIGSDTDPRSSNAQSNASRPSLSLINTRSDARDQPAESSTQNTPLRSGSSPAIWSNWRRDGSASAGPQSTGMDWASASRNRENSYQRKDTGIKVLKPKIAGRTFSSAAASSASGSSSVDGKSRFFDDGRQKLGGEFEEGKSIGADVKVETPLSASATASNASSSAAAPKTKSNPIGGASAFSWLNSGRGAK